MNPEDKRQIRKTIVARRLGEGAPGFSVLDEMIEHG